MANVTLDYIYPTTNTKNIEAVIIEADESSAAKTLPVSIEEMYVYAVSGKLKFKVPNSDSDEGYTLYPISSCSGLTMVHNDVTGDTTPSFKVGFHNGIEESDDSYTFTGNSYSNDDEVAGEGQE